MPRMDKIPKEKQEEMKKGLVDAFFRNCAFLDMDEITNVELMGPRCIRMDIADCAFKCVFFIYYDDTNWNLGTKPWRNPPMSVQKRYEETRKAKEVSK